MRLQRWGRCRLAVAVVLITGTGCATLQQALALRHVDFHLDGVSDARIAGIDLKRIQGYGDLSLADGARLAAALSTGDVPLDLKLDLVGENPADNPTDARLVRMEWTLLLERTETVRGVFDREVVMPPGEATSIPLRVSLNLVDFFEGSGRDLVELALSLTGQGGESKEVALEATPTVETALGPIRYPRPITIVRRDVGR